MAIINQGILAGLSGKIGSVVGSSWKGIPVLRTKALSVSNPKTSGQIVQRNAFTKTVSAATALLSYIIIPLWNRFSVKMSGYNAFVSSNIPVFKNGFSGFSSDFVISRGEMAASPITSVSLEFTSHILYVGWTSDGGQGYKLANDKVYCVVMSQDGTVYDIYKGSSVRSDAQIQWTLNPMPAAGTTLAVYLAFARQDGTVVSNTSMITVSPL